MPSWTAATRKRPAPLGGGGADVGAIGDAVGKI